MAKPTMAQLQARQARMQQRAERQRKELARVRRAVEKQQQQADLARLAAMGRVVEQRLGIRVADELEEWLKLRGVGRYGAMEADDAE